MAAFKLPAGPERDQTVEDATKKAAEVPLAVMKTTLEVLRLARVVAEKGNQRSITDAGVAGLMARGAIEGARYNVLINLTGLSDRPYADRLKTEVAEIATAAAEAAEEVRRLVEAKL